MLVTPALRDANGNPELESEESIHQSFSHVRWIMSGDESYGNGTLFVTTKKITWLSETQNRGFTIDFHDIMLHAISRDERPCIYMQLDSEEEVIEVRVVPNEESELEEIFAAMAHCAALNPDEEQEGEGEFFFNQATTIGGGGRTDAEIAAANLEHLESVFVPPSADELRHMNEGGQNGMNSQFQDAEEDQGMEDQS